MATRVAPFSANDTVSGPLIVASSSTTFPSVTMRSAESVFVPSLTCTTTP